MFQTLMAALIPLFVTIDPPGMVPLFLTVTDGMSPTKRRAVALQAVVIATAFTLSFIFLGKRAFAYMGIDTPDFQVAGGLILLGLTMIDLLGQGKLVRSDDSSIAVSPLAVPIIAGPATLTTALVLAGRPDIGYGYAATSVLMNFFLLLVTLLASTWITQLVGKSFLRAVGKIIMILLAAIAVNMIHIGVKAMIKGP